MASKMIEEDAFHLESAQALVPTFKSSEIRKLPLSEISLTGERFFIEGKVLNVYGTYDSKKDFRKYLKTDLTDDVGFNTVTLIVGPNFYKSYLKTIVEGVCLRIEGPSVQPRNPHDGGSLDFSLVVDTTTIIIQILPFETELFFVPELSIHTFLLKVATNPVLKTTIAVVIVQVNNVQKSEGGVFEQLTIADGPSPHDRATLTFVSKRKALYYQMVDDFQKGNIIPFVARNIGAWKDHSNTLSILDITLIASLYGDKRRCALEDAFHVQIKSLGYGKEVVGSLRITNFNSNLLIRKCAVCKSTNINLLSEGAFCYSCGGRVLVSESIKLVGEIEQAGQTIDVMFVGEIVDKILQFEKPLLSLCKNEQRLARNFLSEVVVKGAFVLDPHGQVIGFS